MREWDAYLSSNFSSTVGCRMPKTPMTDSCPPMRRCIDAAWPAKKVGSKSLTLVWSPGPRYVRFPSFPSLNFVDILRIEGRFH